MNKFSEFINENIINEKEQEFYINRMKNLLNIVLPLIQETQTLYPNVKKWKRCSTLTNMLKESIDKVNKRKLVVPIRKRQRVENNTPIILGNDYLYVPNKDTLPYYDKTYGHRIVKLIKIEDNHNDQWWDSKKNSNYLIEIFIPYSGKMQFWTRKECLKKPR